MGDVFKANKLSKEILGFLKYKIINNGLYDMFNKVNESFQLMLQYGMTYYTGICYKNAIVREMTVFANMLEILHFWEENCFWNKKMIINYLKYNTDFLLNLSGIDLRNVTLVGVHLRGSDLTGANLERANLMNAELVGANFHSAHLERIELVNAILIGADLTEADLTEANLKNANLRNAVLLKANLNNACLKGAILAGSNLMEANLVGTNLIDASFIDVNLKNANLNGSIWKKNNIQLFSSELQEANFRYIIEEYNNKQSRKYRSELFPDEYK